MTETLQATFEARRSGSNMVRLSGVIDERSDFIRLLDAVPSGHLVVHMGNVQKLNDAGMRAWVAWLSMLDARNIRADLVACSPELVEAFNADAQLARCARVKSVQAKYRCAKCRRDEMQLVTIVEVQKMNGEAPHRACATCIGRLTMVEDPARYFEFVAQLPRMSYSSMDSSSLVAQLAKGSRVKVSIPSGAMLPIRPSTLSVMKSVMAKNSVRPTSSDRNYIIVLVVVLLAILGALAGLFLSL